MEILSLLGIGIGIGFFIFCCFKGIQMFLAALGASAVIVIFSGMPLLEMLDGVWAESTGGFIRDFILIFVGGCLYGKTLADGGGSRSLAFAFAKLVRRSRKNQKYICVLFVPVMYMLLTYVGVNSFVIVFTVLYTAGELYREIDVPWRFYCYGGASSLAPSLLGGNMQVTNIQLSEMYGTSLTSGMALSVVAFAAYLLTFLVLAKLDITRAERRGEGFMDTGSAFAEMRDREGAAAEENLPKARYSLISMVSVVACAILSEVLIGILVGILLNLLFFRKHYSRLNHTIAEGVTSGFGPALNAAATVGLASLVAAAPGFALVSDAFSALPPAYSGLAVVLLMTFLTASATGAISAFGPGILASMTAAGYSAAVTHRLLCMTVVTSTCPHSPGVVNSVMLAKIPYRKALPVYLKMSLIPGFFALAATLLCVQNGIFV